MARLHVVCAGAFAFPLALGVCSFEPMAERRRMLLFSASRCNGLYILWDWQRTQRRFTSRKQHCLCQPSNQLYDRRGFLSHRYCGSLFFSKVKAMVILARKLAILLAVTAVKRYAFTRCGVRMRDRKCDVLVYFWRSSERATSLRRSSWGSRVARSGDIVDAAQELPRTLQPKRSALA